MNDNLVEQYNNFAYAYSLELPTQDAQSNSRFYKILASIDLQGKELLDIGCGDGTDLVNYKRMSALCCGIDPSQAFIAIARDRLPGVQLLVAQGESIPFEDNSFDIVVSKYALQSSGDVPTILREVARVLRTGGDFIYLSKHPLRQFVENIYSNGAKVNYFEQQIVDSFIYNRTIQLREPTHTLGEYFSAEVLIDFDLVNFIEDHDFPSSEQLGGHDYPTFFIAKLRRR